MSKYVRYSAFNGEIISRQNYNNRQEFINSIITTIKINPNFLGGVAIGDTYLSNYELTKWFGPLIDLTKKDLNKLCKDLLKGAE